MLTKTKTITVYSVPGCMQCRASIKDIEKFGGEALVVDLSLDENRRIREDLVAAGFSQAPIVETADGTRWQGYYRHKIQGALRA